MHDRHEALGARWIDMGDWKRPFAYGDVADECRAVREAAGLIDVSTLGKLDVRVATRARSSTGCTRTASATSGWGGCATGRCSMTPGSSSTTGRSPGSATDRFFVSTTTGNLDAVDQWFGWWLAGGDAATST